MADIVQFADWKRRRDAAAGTLAGESDAASTTPRPCEIAKRGSYEAIMELWRGAPVSESYDG